LYFLNIIILKNSIDEFCEYINYTRNLEFEQEPNYEYLRGLFRYVMVKNNYINDSQYDWVKTLKKDDKLIISNNNSNKIPLQYINNNLLNNKININSISNYNNINTIQNTNNIGKLNLNITNEIQNPNLFINISTTKNTNQNFLTKSITKLPKGIAIEPIMKYSGLNNYNYNFPINNINVQRNSLNNLYTSKLKFLEIAPKTNKNEAFPTL